MQTVMIEMPVGLALFALHMLGAIAGAIVGFIVGRHTK
jgi:hypothetical protein